ncbi:hypothetical protein SERLA73DRAFT_162817 [Serpula lacrymans var. lacrymans S7.3]|uniref:Uncharacterized protein n=1 Tax=Serpula lacrymans var. lacrymans (strain S7.3) TaxID=936435 RepID=F8QAB5_SERL3|nr:hypothetical protein SERLA73DRAFT_162817 [Serpula lacrymans var. lacrymans S7.3]
MPVPVLVEPLADYTASAPIVKPSVKTAFLLQVASPTPNASCNTPNCEEGFIKLALVPAAEHVSNWLDSVLRPVLQLVQGQEASESNPSGASPMSVFKGHRSGPAVTSNLGSGARNPFVFSTFLDSPSSNSNSTRRTFLLGFDIFQIHGAIDLTAHTLTNGTLIVVVPVFGPLRLTETIGGSLDDHNIKVKLPSTTNVNGSFTLSLDSKGENLLIDYNIDVRFAGTFQGSGVTVVSVQASPPPSTTLSYPVEISELAVKKTDVLTISFADLTKHADLSYENSVFDSFIENHFDEQHKHIIVDQKGGMNTRGYNFRISFLDIYELQGHLNLHTKHIVATLYLVVPIWGRISAAAISGSLANDLTADINLTRPWVENPNCCVPVQLPALAQGSITLSIQDQILWAKVSTLVRFAGFINETVPLVTLPPF